MTPSSFEIETTTRERSGEAIWNLCQELLHDGTTYIFRPDTSKEDLLRYWFPESGRTYLATRGKEILGCYLVRPNQGGRGSHVANASYFVASAVRGGGIGRALAEHSLSEALSMGYQAMQFNLVVATNRGAIGLWETLGFKTIGVIPRAFDHAELGLTDALIMHRFL